MHLISLKKKSNTNNTNSLIVITFSSQILNHINMNSLLNDEQCNFPIKNVYLSRTFNYPIQLGRKLLNYNTFFLNPLHQIQKYT